jgi:hypothetical protein
MVLTTFAWIHRKSSKSTTTDDEKTERISSLFIPNRIHRLFSTHREKGRGQLVPTLSSIIKAGDEGVYNSTLWNELRGHPGDITLEMLYDLFERASKEQTTTERFPNPIRSPSGEPNTLKRGKSLGATKEGRYEFQPRTQRRSMDILERGLVGPKSRRSAPMLVSMMGALEEATTGIQTTTVPWIKDVQHAHQFLGQTGVPITALELAALGLVLGCPPNGLEQTEQSYDFGKGAFGISITSRVAGVGKHHIHVTQHKRPLSHLPSKGSGYSAIFAKHLPFGSLPYSQTATRVNSILITDATLQALRTGTPVCLKDTEPQNSASIFLPSLPSSRTTAFQCLTTSPTCTPSEPPTALLNAIAALPFTGGLVPLASAPIIQTVHFVSSTGLPVGRLLQRLDALVEKVHRLSPHLHLFGPLLDSGNAGLLYRERERLGRLATGAAVEDTIGAKAARMQRYITLLERMMALVPGMKPGDVLTAVKQATKLEMERSYEDAVASFRNGDADQDYVSYGSKRTSVISNKRKKSKRLSSSSYALASTAPHTPTLSTLTHNATAQPPIQQSTPASPTSPILSSSRNSSTFPEHNLGRQVEELLKLSLPLDLQSIAKLVRLVVAAWTVSVECVEPSQLVLGGAEKMVLF